jgi:bifunctional DNase/RNase
MTGPRQPFVMLVLMACAAGAGLCIVEHRAPRSVELHVRELVRVRGGQTVMVLEETGGSRRLPIPLTRAEAATIEREMHSPGGLASEAVDALGGRVLNATIDEVSGERGYRAHISLGSGSRELRLAAGAAEAVSLALQAGAPIVADPAVLDAAAVSPDDLHGKAARGLRSSRTPAPVLRI